MHMKYSVAVVGASGFAGGEILRILSDHPNFVVGDLFANSSAGTLLREHHPHLRSLGNRELKAVDIGRINAHDAVILALPHGASGKIASQLSKDIVAVDLGADHRLEAQSDWDNFYGGEFSPHWTYGMPELRFKDESSQRDLLRGTKQIAVPGCNVTAVTLGLAPVAFHEIADLTSINAVLTVGYSGAGKSLKPNLMACAALGNSTAYAVGGVHRHIPEIEQNLYKVGNKAVNISFTPVLVPMNRGILAVMNLELRSEYRHIDDEQLRLLWQNYYLGEQFIEVLPKDVWPSTVSVLGSNSATVQVTKDQHSNKLVVQCAIDNLVKGTAGAAVQSINIALGLEEAAGLEIQGVSP